MEQMTLSGLLKALMWCDPKASIAFDFCGFKPGTFHSYRGFYDHLGLGYELEAMCSVQDLLDRGNDAFGKSFTGWKGGGYVMGGTTPIWISSPSTCYGTALAGVDDHEHHVVLRTIWIDA